MTTAASNINALTTAASLPTTDRRIAVVLFGTIAAMQLATALFREVNWDEFYFLSFVFEYERRALTHAMQTFHVHLFWWLTLLPTDDIGRIVAARCLMLALHLATLWFLFQTARSLVSVRGAFWATILYATFSFVVQHATSFRADPIITTLLMSSLFGLTRERLSVGTLVVAALAVALAGLISVKSVFYVPIIVMVAFLRLARSSQKGKLVRDMGIALAAAAIAFAGLHLWHAASLGVPGLAATNTLPDVYAKQLADNGLFHGARFLFYAVIRNVPQWLLIVTGIGLAAAQAWKSRGANRLCALTVLGFASPLLLIAFYRNSFPYFYVFMMAPVAVVAALAADALAGLSKTARILPALMVVLAAIGAVPELRRDHSAQRSLMSAVHEIFPEPVPYIDRSSMIASYPNAGFLMSTWGMEEYRRRGEPVFLRAIGEKKPLFVIVSHPSLAAALEPGGSVAPEYELLPADAAALRENYIRHWGPLWIAGKRLVADGKEAGFRIAIPGDYTVEADSGVEIDGKPATPGDVVTLAVGRHAHRGGAAILRYGNNAPIPARQPPETIFTGF